MLCRHCGRPRLPGASWGDFCCRGCQAVYHFIQGIGLQEYYDYRPQPSGEAVEDRPSLQLYADPQIAQSLLFQERYYCLLDGLHCPACGWLVERALQQLPEVDKVQVNYATQRLSFQPLDGSALLKALERVAHLGYRAIPYDPRRNERPRLQSDRLLLLRFGVAACAAGNVMLVALALYSGADLDASYRPLFQRLSFALTLPVVLFSAQPFWSGAWRAWQQRQLSTDCSIALGLAITFLYSLVATLMGQQQVYFDTVATFVFVLLLGRVLEGAARSRAGLVVERLLSLQESCAWRWNGQDFAEVACEQLAVGDRVLVKAGGRVPADGVVLVGQAYVDESHLTGESQPRIVAPQERVFGGSLSLDGCLEVELQQLGGTSLLAQVARLVEGAQSTPSRLQQAADRLAGKLLPALIVLAGLTGLLTHSLDRALAVLIITCPCALGLATPLIVSLASGVAARWGVLFRDGQALESARQLTHIILDKTGTLSQGQLELIAGPRDQRLLWAASLEANCQHPLARALASQCQQALLSVEDWTLVAGQGVEGTLEGRRMRLGRAQFLGRPELDRESRHTSVWLEVDQEIVARFDFADRLRPEAAEFVDTLRRRGLKVLLASGDRFSVVSEVAAQLGLHDFRANCLPQDKLEWVTQLQQQGAVVAFLGDGINDAPALRKAHLGLTVANGSELSWEVADLVLLRPGLAPAVLALDLADQAWRRLRTNLGLALLYNGLAIPAAAMGWVTPLTAAIAMPLSSLVVVGQSLALLGYRPRKELDLGRSLLSDSGRPSPVRPGPGTLCLGGGPGAI